MRHNYIFLCLVILVLTVNDYFLKVNSVFTPTSKVSDDPSYNVRTFDITTDSFNLVVGETLYVFFDTVSYYGPPKSFSQTEYSVNVHTPDECASFKQQFLTNNPNIGFASEILHPALPHHIIPALNGMTEEMRSPDEYACVSFTINESNITIRDIPMSVTRYGTYPEHSLKIVILNIAGTYRTSGPIQMSTFTHNPHILDKSRPLETTQFGQSACDNAQKFCDVEITPFTNVILDDYLTYSNFHTLGFYLDVDGIGWDIDSCVSIDSVTNPLVLTYQRINPTDDNPSKTIATFTTGYTSNVNKNSFQNFQLPKIKCKFGWARRAKPFNWDYMNGQISLTVLFLNREYSMSTIYSHSSELRQFSVDSVIENMSTKNGGVKPANSYNMYTITYTPSVTVPLYFYLTDCGSNTYVKFINVNSDTEKLLPNVPLADCSLKPGDEVITCVIEAANVSNRHQFTFGTDQLNKCRFKVSRSKTTTDASFFTHLLIPDTKTLALKNDIIPVSVTPLNSAMQLYYFEMWHVVDANLTPKLDIITPNILVLEESCESYTMSVKNYAGDDVKDPADIGISKQDIKRVYTFTSSSENQARILSCLIYMRFNHFPKNTQDEVKFTSQTRVFNNDDHNTLLIANTVDTMKPPTNIEPLSFGFDKKLTQTIYNEGKEFSESKLIFEFELDFIGPSSYFVESAGVEYIIESSHSSLAFEDCTIDTYHMNSTVKTTSSNNTSIFSHKNIQLPFPFDINLTTRKNKTFVGFCTGFHNQTAESKTNPPSFTFTFNVHGKEFQKTFPVDYITPPPPPSDSYEIISSHLNVTSKDSLTPDEIQKILDQYKDKVKEELTGGVNVEEGVYIDDIEETRSVDSIHTDITVNVDLDTVGGGSDLESVENINDNFSDSFDQVFVDKGWKVEVSPPTVTKIPKHCRTGCGVGCLCEEGKPCTADNECKTNHCKFETSGFISHFSSHSVSHSENGQTGVCAQFKDPNKDNSSLLSYSNHIYLLTLFVFFCIFF